MNDVPRKQDRAPELAQKAYRLAPVLRFRIGVESAAVGVIALLVAGLSVLVASSRDGVLGAALAITMLAIALIDLRRFIIPDELVVLGLALALINAGIQDGGTVAESILAAGLRGAVLSAAFLGVRAVYGLVRQREGMGLGDVKLAAVAGAWLDCATIPLCVEIAAFSALTIYLLRQLTNGGPIRAMTRVPFGLFFAPAIWLSWLIEQLLLRS